MYLFSNQILIQSVYETVVPKLVAEDIPLLQSLLSDVFPGVRYVSAEMKALKAEIKKVCTEMNLVYGDGEEQGGSWVEKVRGVFSNKKKLIGFDVIEKSGVLQSTVSKRDPTGLARTVLESVFLANREF